MTITKSALSAGWSSFFGDFGGRYAITAAYNNHHAGTAAACYRIGADGECVRLYGSGVSARYGVNRVSGARHIPLEQVHSDLDRIHARVDRALFGTRFNRLPEDARTAFVGRIEHPHTNLHVHLSWRVPEVRAEEFTQVISEAWRAVSPASTIDVQPIRDAGWGQYIAKDQWGQEDAALFVASRALRST